MLAARLRSLVSGLILCAFALFACGDDGGEGDRPDASMEDAGAQVDCSAAQVLDSDIDSDTTLPRDCYRVTDGILVSAALTIEPGAVLEFEAGAGLKIESDGTIEAAGTASAPILFTAADAISGDWRGLVIDSSSPDNTVDHVIIEYAGDTGLSFNRNTPGNLILLEDARASVTNSTFALSSDYGVSVATGVELLAFEGNEFAENEGPPMRLNSKQIGFLGGGNVFATDAAPGKAYVELAENSTGTERSVTQSSQTWPALDVPYRFFGSHFIDDSAAVVTIEEGAVLEFAENAGLRVDQGAVVAVGTEEDPVTFTGAQKVAGEWRGLFIDSIHSSNELQHAVVEFAGDESLPFNGNTSANLIIGEGARSVVTDSEFRNSSGFGIYTEGTIFNQDGDEIAPDGGNNSFDGNETPFNEEA